MRLAKLKLFMILFLENLKFMVCIDSRLYFVFDQLKSNLKYYEMKFALE
jgi:hypothetical protein